MQAAIGVEQIRKLPGFIERRKENFNALYHGLKKYENDLILPRATPHSAPSWFGFPIIVREDSSFKRDDIVRYLEEHKIATRMLFGGNLLKQPAYLGINSRGVDSLKNTDLVMDKLFWIGVYPGLTDQMIKYINDTFTHFFSSGRPFNG
jgi:CDP-6-deoxy-D-xylo-4-hexulose-3-dehydrase